MTDPSTNNRPKGDRSVAKALLADVTNLWTVAIGITAFVIGAVSTFFALRSSRASVQLADIAIESGITLLVANPQEMVLMQTRVACVIGVLLACETVLYRMRHTQPIDRWLHRWPHRSSIRITVLVASVVAFPIGCVVGYNAIVPVLLELLAGADPSWAINHIVELAYYTAITTGVLAQLAVCSFFVAGARVGA